MDPTLQTARFVLRPFRPGDAPAVQALAGNWKVARMTSRIPHPYPDGFAEGWIAGHAVGRRHGDAWPFAIDSGGRLVGAIGLERSQAGVFELGYWIGEPWWGQGIATEAARRIVRFAFEALDAERVSAGYLALNRASGRVLEKCGFRYSGDYTCRAAARACSLPARRMVLARDDLEVPLEQR